MITLRRPAFSPFALMAWLSPLTVQKVDGSRNIQSLYSWRAADGGQIRWSIYDLMRIAGYKETKYARYWDTWRDQKELWRASLDHRGIVSMVETGDSDIMAQKKGASAEELSSAVVEDQCWASTVAGRIAVEAAVTKKKLEPLTKSF